MMEYGKQDKDIECRNRVLDTGFMIREGNRILDKGYRMQDTGYMIRDTEYMVYDVRRRIQYAQDSCILLNILQLVNDQRKYCCDERREDGRAVHLCLQK